MTPFLPIPRRVTWNVCLKGPLPSAAAVASTDSGDPLCWYDAPQGVEGLKGSFADTLELPPGVWCAPPAAASRAPGTHPLPRCCPSPCTRFCPPVVCNRSAHPLSQQRGVSVPRFLPVRGDPYGRLSGADTGPDTSQHPVSPGSARRRRAPLRRSASVGAPATAAPGAAAAATDGSHRPQPQPVLVYPHPAAGSPGGAGSTPRHRGSGSGQLGRASSSLRRQGPRPVDVPGAVTGKAPALGMGGSRRGGSAAAADGPPPQQQQHPAPNIFARARVGPYGRQWRSRRARGSAVAAAGRRGGRGHPPAAVRPARRWGQREKAEQQRGRESQGERRRARERGRRHLHRSRAYPPAAAAARGSTAEEEPLPPAPNKQQRSFWRPRRGVGCAFRDARRCSRLFFWRSSRSRRQGRILSAAMLAWQRCSSVSAGLLVTHAER